MADLGCSWYSVVCIYLEGCRITIVSHCWILSVVFCYILCDLFVCFACLDIPDFFFHFYLVSDMLFLSCITLVELTALSLTPASAH